MIKTKTTLLIKDVIRNKVLALNTNKGWSFPVVSEGPIGLVNIKNLQKASSTMLGGKVTIGRQLLQRKDGNVIEYIYEAFLIQEAVHGVWIDAKKIKLDEEIIRKWIEEKETPVLRAPWFNAEFYKNAESWIFEKLEQAGYQITGDIEQLKATDFSYILIVPTSVGSVYFKTSGTSRIYEAAVSKYMNKRYQGKTTSIIALDKLTGWFLMNDLGGVPLRELKDQEIWINALREYAELQVAEIEHVQELLKLGVPERSISLLKKQIELHLEEMCNTGLSVEDKAKVMSIQPELMAMCDELQELVPFQSIEHGDLHSANIQSLNGNSVFLDWGDSAVSHPFFSTRVFWNSLYDLVENDTEKWLEKIEQFKPIYLKAWTKFAKMEKLERALAISNQLGCLHRGLSYYLYYTPTVEDQSDYNKPSQWLMALLEERESDRFKLGKQ